MIVGSGLLAKAFCASPRSWEGWIIFASGVSNSSGDDAEEFAREEALLRSWLARGERLVYFSSCGLVDEEALDTPYMAHKRRMERLVLESSMHTRVLRLPQVIGASGNRRTLANYLHDKLVAGEHFEVWEFAERNLVDVEDVVAIAHRLLLSASIEARVINIAAERSSAMVDIVQILERTLGLKGSYTLVPKGRPLHIDISVAAVAASSLGIDMGETYLERIFAKYYSPRGQAGGVLK